MKKILAIVMTLTTLAFDVRTTSYAVGNKNSCQVEDASASNIDNPNSNQQNSINPTLLNVPADTGFQQMEERGITYDVKPQGYRTDSSQSNLGNPTSSQAHKDVDPQRMDVEDTCSDIPYIFSEEAVDYVFGDDSETEDVLQPSLDDRVESEKSKADKNVHDKETNKDLDLKLSDFMDEIVFPEDTDKQDNTCSKSSSGEKINHEEKTSDLDKELLESVILPGGFSESGDTSHTEQHDKTTDEIESLRRKRDDDEFKETDDDDEFIDFEISEDDDIEDSCLEYLKSVAYPRKKKSRLKLSSEAESISRVVDPNCVKVYVATESIDKSAIINDGKGSQENIEQILKQKPDKTVIAVCPQSSDTSFKEVIKKIFDEKLEENKEKNLIIYFGGNVYFDSDSFINREINADIIVCGAKLISKSFHDNTINGMCILFNPVINTKYCFFKNTVSKGLFVVGDYEGEKNKGVSYAISQPQNVCYLSGINLLEDSYKIPLPLTCTTEFSDILDYVIKKSEEFETPRVGKYAPEMYKYNSYDQDNLDIIAEKLPDRTIIAVCSPCKIDFLFANTKSFDLCKQLSDLYRDPDIKNPIIYFGCNVFFGNNSFTPESLGIEKFNADIIICGSKFAYKAFRDNVIGGMCIIFNPVMNLPSCFCQNEILKGLFVVGNRPIKEYKDKSYSIISPQNACYLSGDNLMEESYKMQFPTTYTKDFSGILAYVISKSEEFEIPRVGLYDSETYKYNDYDKKNLDTIAEKMPGRIIIAVCSPCKLNFSDIKADFDESYKYLVSNSYEKPIIYFGSNVHFGINSFINHIIDADIIICGAEFVCNGFYNNTINGMCVLFNPKMEIRKCIFQNTFRKGLFVVGNSPHKDMATLKYPIRQYHNVCYLSGENLMGDIYKVSLPLIYKVDISGILDYAILKSDEFETPQIAKYNPTTYTYNEYDQDKLEIIREKNSTSIIIAVCSPCRMEFSDIKDNFIAIYNKYRLSDPDKKLIIYFGQNVHFNRQSFTPDSLGIKGIKADIIICGSIFSGKAFIGNTINGMCILFNPVVEAKNIFFKNTISKGLFVVGNTEKGFSIFLSSPKKWYLFGEGLMKREILQPETIPVGTFEATLSFALSKDKEISLSLTTADTITKLPTSETDMEDKASDDKSPSSTTVYRESHDMMDEEVCSDKLSTLDAVGSTTEVDRVDQTVAKIENMLNKSNSEELKEFLSDNGIFEGGVFNKEDLKEKLQCQIIDLAKLTLIVMRQEQLLLTTSDEELQPQNKKLRLEQNSSSERVQEALIFKAEDPDCVQVYLGTEPIDESKVVNDDVNSKANIMEIRKQMSGRTIIAVCPKNPNTSFKDTIKKIFIDKYKENFNPDPEKKPIIYFGSNVYFRNESFILTSEIPEINADIIICGASFGQRAFYENKINGMCVIFNPVMSIGSFYKNEVLRGLFVAGSGSAKSKTNQAYSICQTANACYLFGDNLMEESYKMQLPTTYTKDFSGILAYAISRSEEFETPQVGIYDPKEYTYNSEDKKDLEIIAAKMPRRTIIAICPPCKLNVSDIKADFDEAYNKYWAADPDENPIVYFGRNINFNRSSFVDQKIKADIIICGSKFSQASFEGNIIEGMCILFNSIMKSELCFIQNTIYNGLFVVGYGVSRNDKNRYPVVQCKNACYLFGENLMDNYYKISLPSAFTNDFLGILSYAIMKAKEFETPRVGLYDPEKYIYNSEDKENLSTIAAKMFERTIIAVCPPCPMDLSSRSEKPFDLFSQLIGLYKDPEIKNPIIYFGQYVYFNIGSFTPKSLGTEKEINADIIICGSKFAQKSFQSTTINGMCILFNPVMGTQACCFKNTVSKGLFVVGDYEGEKNKGVRYAISQPKNVCYLSGTDLLEDSYKIPLPLTCTTEFSDILDYVIKKSEEFETPRVGKYAPEMYKYNSYDQDKLEIIKRKNPTSIIIAICSPCRMEFSDIKDNFIATYDKYRISDPDKKLIIYFGQNVCFNYKSFTQSLGIKEINADIIVCGSIFSNKAFQNNTINGMCVLFNPVMNSGESFITCNITKGLFVVGDGPVISDKRRSYPIVQRKNVYYLYGENLMAVKYRSWITLENDFTKLLEYAISISE